ncbi:MarR family winged helix-turn-helix transcriptional regulator [Peptoniphilus raoultii]|uniref:MarR family winged helix-turn-helix transcriptional regulator n=1 Tax=Peptoniphilus raoultii TaxID=1776387 RepID=UPI0008DABFAC|nr:MarR family transcriptional regulator [Peptoniphilus raoultii]
MKIEGGYLIGRAKFLSGRKLNKLFSEYGLTEFNGEQGKILYYLWKKDDFSSTDLSLETGLAINTLTNMLNKMEQEDLIYRKQCDRDKRKKYIFLTEKGRSLETKSKIATDRMNEIFYKDFSLKDIETFENMLRKIISNLEEEDD